MCDNYSFYTTGVDNFSPLFIKSMFNSDSYTMHKVPSRSLSDLFKMFKRFVSQTDVPNNVISDRGSDFVSVESQEFING